jgi:hypothetical protein
VLGDVGRRTPRLTVVLAPAVPGVELVILAAETALGPIFGLLAVAFGVLWHVTTPRPAPPTARAVAPFAVPPALPNPDRTSGTSFPSPSGNRYPPCAGSG